MKNTLKIIISIFVIFIISSQVSAISVDKQKVQNEFNIEKSDPYQPPKTLYYNFSKAEIKGIFIQEEVFSEKFPFLLYKRPIAIGKEKSYENLHLQYFEGNITSLDPSIDLIDFLNCSRYINGTMFSVYLKIESANLTITKVKGYYHLEGIVYNLNVSIYPERPNEE